MYVWCVCVCVHKGVGYVIPEKDESSSCIVYIYFTTVIYSRYLQNGFPYRTPTFPQNRWCLKHVFSLFGETSFCVWRHYKHPVRVVRVRNLTRSSNRTKPFYSTDVVPSPAGQPDSIRILSENNVTNNLT